MSNINHLVRPHDYILPTTNSPSLGKVVHATAGSGVVETLSYDQATKEYGYFTFRATQYNPGSTVYVDVDWYPNINSSGNVRWDCALGAITADVDTEPVPNVGLTLTGPASVGYGQQQRLVRSTVTFSGSNLDNMASEDYVTVKVARDAGHAGDTLNGDAHVVMTTVRYAASGV